MTWAFYFALVWALIGLASCLVLLRSHLQEAKERRKLEIHRWAMDAERENLKAAAMHPVLYKGYRMDHERKS